VAGDRRARGDFAGALTIYEQALKIRRDVAKSDAGNREFQHELSTALGYVGRAAHNTGDQAKALQSLREAIAVGQPIVAAGTAPAAWQSDLSYALLLAGDVLSEQNNSSEALDRYVRSEQRGKTANWPRPGGLR
jgi:tetratricopeptide (TPR) repeat protein